MWHVAQPDDGDGFFGDVVNNRLSDHGSVANSLATVSAPMVAPMMALAEIHQSRSLKFTS
jgi:hypothetical protein